MKEPFSSPVLISALGFSLNEKVVLDALISLKMSHNVSQIAKRADLPRTTTLYILKKFEKRKLARKVLTKKRYKWMYNRATNHILSKRNPD